MSQFISQLVCFEFYFFVNLQVINILCLVFCRELQVRTLLFLYLNNESLHSI